MPVASGAALGLHKFAYPWGNSSAAACRRGQIQGQPIVFLSWLGASSNHPIQQKDRRTHTTISDKAYLILGHNLLQRMCLRPLFAYYRYLPAGTFDHNAFSRLQGTSHTGLRIVGN